MSLIQGVGDEVVLFFGFMLGLFGVLLVYLLKPSRSRLQNREQILTSYVGPLVEGGDTNRGGVRRRQLATNLAANDEPNSDINIGTVGSGESLFSENPSLLTGALDSDPTSNSGRDRAEDYSNNICFLRLVHQETSYNVQCSFNRVLNTLAEEYFPEATQSAANVRFIYRGRILDSFQTIQQSGVTNGSALHVHFSTRQPHSGTPFVQNGPIVWDISWLFLPFLGLILVCIWIVLIYRPFLFTLLTKVLLYFLSFGYLVILYSVHFSVARPTV